VGRQQQDLGRFRTTGQPKHLGATHWDGEPNDPTVGNRRDRSPLVQTEPPLTRSPPATKRSRPRGGEGGGPEGEHPRSKAQRGPGRMIGPRTRCQRGRRGRDLGAGPRPGHPGPSWAMQSARGASGTWPIWTSSPKPERGDTLSTRPPVGGYEPLGALSRVFQVQLLGPGKRQRFGQGDRRRTRKGSSRWTS